MPGQNKTIPPARTFPIPKEALENLWDAAIADSQGNIKDAALRYARAIERLHGIT